MDSDKRRQYRSHAPIDLQVQVRLGREETVHGTLVDLSGWGAGVAFAASDDPGLEEGRGVVLQFVEDRARLFLGALARVNNRQEADGEVRYGFEFTDLRRLHRFLPAELRPYFNRRRLVRISPPRDQDVGLRIARGEECLEATVHDVCAVGMGVRYAGASAPELREGDGVVLAIELPGGRGPAILGARVIHASAKGSSGRAGLAFVERRDPAFQRTQQRVHEFSLELQREMLQRKLT